MGSPQAPLRKKGESTPKPSSWFHIPRMDMFLVNTVTDFVLWNEDGRVRHASSFESIYMEGYLPWKVVLSSEPTDPDCVVMAILCHCEWLALCKPGDDDWKLMYDSKLPLVDDILFHKGKFYGCFLNSVCFYDTVKLEINYMKLEEQGLDELAFEYSYMVEHGGHMLLVSECQGVENIFIKVDLKNAWLQLLDPRVVGDRAFSVAGNQAISLTASRYGTPTENCISFHFRKGNHGVCVFDCCENDIPRYLSRNEGEAGTNWKLMAWFTPNLCCDPPLLSEMQHFGI